MRLVFFALAAAVVSQAADPAVWTKYRGPKDDGVAVGDAPTEWSDTKNVAWKIEIPGRGHSSPVLWGDRIFVTTAVPTAGEEATGAASGGGAGGRGAGGGAGKKDHTIVVMSLDAKTGKLIWQREAAKVSPHEGYHFRYGSFASNSPTTDGKLLYAFFGSFGLYVYDLDGKLAWKKSFNPMRMRNEFGEGVAPVLYGDKLLLKFDGEQNSHFLVLDKTTGKEIWRVDRDEVSSWSPPLVVDVKGKKQVIISASAKTRAYDLENGKVIWECAGLGTNVIPAPVLFEDTVIVMSGHRSPNLQAIRLGKEGDLTNTDAVIWQNQRGNSYTPAPVLHEGKLYMVTDNGMLSCLNAKTGEPYYLQQRLPKPYSFKASPVAANGKLYLATENDDVVVVKLGEKFEVLATNTLADQMFIATPAIANGSIYLRGQKTLFCIRP